MTIKLQFNFARIRLADYKRIISHGSTTVTGVLILTKPMNLFLAHVPSDIDDAAEKLKVFISQVEQMIRTIKSPLLLLLLNYDVGS